MVQPDNNIGNSHVSKVVSPEKLREALVHNNLNISAEDSIIILRFLKTIADITVKEFILNSVKNE